MVSSGHHLSDSRTMPVISPDGFDAPPPPSKCGGCGVQIVDRYYLHAAERQWHVSCLRCYTCKSLLDQEMSCYFRNGHIYCKEDYYRLVAVKSCSRCQQGIYASDLVMRVRDLVFHTHCFTCAWCNTALRSGEYFGLRENLVYCRPHYEMITRDLYAPSPDPSHPHLHPAEDGMMPGFGYAGSLPLGSGGPVVNPSGRKGRPRKKKNGDLAGADLRHGTGLSPIDPTSCNLHLSHLDGTNSSQSSPPMSGSGGQRTKRMRTSFKHHQLRTMKSYFAINQNPDAKDLKHLAQKTGLSKRVLQVWFQNARAKWRRNNMKLETMPGIMGNDQSPNSQMHQGGHMGGDMCSPSATSSYSEQSPVHSCGGIPSDGSISTQIGPGASMDFDSSNPLTPLINHHGLNPGSVHNGEPVMHMTTFHEIF